MIKINLLPQTSQKGVAARATGGGSNHNKALLLAGTVVVMVALNAMAGWAAFRSVYTAKEEVDRIKDKCDLVDKQIKNRMSEADLVRKYREVVTNQMDVLKSLDPPERILWCEKINMLSNLIPPEVFLTEVAVTEHMELIETEASKAARSKWEKAKEKVGKEPEIVKRPIISYQMKLTGLALGKESVDQMNNVMKFHTAMTSYRMSDGKGREHRFMDGFNPNIDLGSIEAAVYQGTPVNQFTFTLRTRTMGTEELKKTEPAAEKPAAVTPPRTARAFGVKPDEMGI